MRVIGSDHGGYKLKEEIKRYLDETDIKYIDKGCFSQFIHNNSIKIYYSKNNTLFTDSKSMKLQDFFYIVLQILTNWYVIGTVVAMLLIISFANYVIRYKRKPKKKKKKNLAEKAPPKPPKPAPAESSEGEEEGEKEE